MCYYVWLVKYMGKWPLWMYDVANRTWCPHHVFFVSVNISILPMSTFPPPPDYYDPRLFNFKLFPTPPPRLLPLLLLFRTAEYPFSVILSFSFFSIKNVSFEPRWGQHRPPPGQPADWHSLHSDKLWKILTPLEKLCWLRPWTTSKIIQCLFLLSST